MFFSCFFKFFKFFALGMPCLGKKLEVCLGLR